MPKGRVLGRRDYNVAHPRTGENGRSGWGAQDASDYDAKFSYIINECDFVSNNHEAGKGGPCIARRRKVRERQDHAAGDDGFGDCGGMEDRHFGCQLNGEIHGLKRMRYGQYVCIAYGSEGTCRSCFAARTRRAHGAFAADHPRYKNEQCYGASHDRTFVLMVAESFLEAD